MLWLLAETETLAASQTCKPWFPVSIVSRLPLVPHHSAAACFHPWQRKASLLAMTGKGRGARWIQGRD